MNIHFTRALVAFGNENYTAAAEAAHLAAKDQPESLVYTAAATYLNRVCTDGKAGVYVTGEAFAAFIRGGGNLPLYAKLSTTLRNVYTTYNQVSLLDLGVGDGMALLPALSPQVTSLNLVEPSAPMLAQVCAALDARGITYTATNSDFQTFSDQGGCWDLGQATFSLQSLTPTERQKALAWLRSHCIRVLIAEFDVPEFADLYAPERMAHFTTRYEQGLAEYSDDGESVAQGFLMPVFFGYFDQSATRANYEQPMIAWENDLRAAGFSQIERRLIYPYWWAPAYLLDAM